VCGYGSAVVVVYVRRPLGVVLQVLLRRRVDPAEGAVGGVEVAFIRGLGLAVVGASAVYPPAVEAPGDGDWGEAQKERPG